MLSSHDGLCAIGELAERAGVSVRTVRFYSDRGLLPEASRSAGGHRRYGPEAVERLGMIRSLRGLDLPLPEVRRVLDELDGAGDGPAAGGALEGAVAGRLRALGYELAALRWREAALRLVQECPPAERAARLRPVSYTRRRACRPGRSPRFWRRPWCARPTTPGPSRCSPSPDCTRSCPGRAVKGSAVPPSPGRTRSAGPAPLRCCTRGSRRRTAWRAGSCAGRPRPPPGRRWTDSWTRTRVRTAPRTHPPSAAYWPDGWRPIPASTGTGS